MQDNLLEVGLAFDLSNTLQEEFKLQIKALQTSLNKMIESVMPIPDLSNNKISEQFFHSLCKKLPLAAYSFIHSKPYNVISLKFLALSRYTSGMGRFLSDTASSWLVPGKQLPLVNANSTGFKFIKFPQENFFCHDMLILILNEEDFEIAKNNLPHLIRETKINILAVQHARRIVSQKELTEQEKGIVLQETISSLLTKSSVATKSSIYDDVQYFLVKTMADERILQIKEQITPIANKKPEIFERNLFNDLNETLVMLPDEFIAKRDTKYITRMVAYLYLFRKIALSSILLYPNQRHLHFKLLRLHIHENEESLPAIGVILTINLLRENEIIEERHLKRAIESIAPIFKVIMNSFHEKKRLGSTRTFYIEIMKTDRSAFSINELKLIQQRLPTEIKTKIETVINPIFMQKNEEETLKNILVLSNELKYVDDLPQGMIHFHKQTDDYINFTVIIVRLLKDHLPPIKFELQRLSKEFIVDHCDVKNVGLLRKKHPKEANVLEIKLLKNKFLREDFSLDLYEARRVVYNGLKRVLGEIRDYNGGMISKQGEVLGELTKLLLEEDVQNNFLIENYFYSLTPVHMQSVLSARVLKKQFIMVTQALSHDYMQQPYFMQMQIVDNYCILLLASLYSDFKDMICEVPESINIDASCLTTSHLNANDVFCIGYIYQYSHPKDYEKFLIAITEHIKLWKKGFDSAEKFNSFALRMNSPTLK